MRTPFGGLYVVAAGDLVVGIYHEDHDPPPGPVRLGQLLPTPTGSADDDGSAAAAAAAAAAAMAAAAPAGDAVVLDRACRELAEYFEGHRRGFSFPMRATGTTFQEDVWHVLAEIPFGERRSYRDVAGTLRNPAMGRAIGAAIRANPLSIAIPGHRVVSSSGKVVGYAAGAGVKSALLDLELSLCEQPQPTAASGAADAPNRPRL